MRKDIGIALLALVAAVAPPTPARSGPGDLGGALRWRLVGPYRGGRVTTVAGVPGEPLVYYQGATGGGVWKTEDAGLSWQNVTDGFFKTGSVGAIAVAPSNPLVVYVGMGEACLRSNLSHGDGVYKSADGGKTWRHLGLDDTRQIGQIRVHPRDPDVVYVAALGDPYGPNEERGVFRSTDGGATWEKALFVNEDTGAVDLAMDPRDPQVLYAALWQVRRKPWGIYDRGPGSGLYKTTDGGASWQELATGLPSSEKGRIGVSVSPVAPTRVWALVDAAEGGGLYLSDDAGRSFRLVNDDFNMTRRAYYYGHVYADTQDRDTVYVLTSPFMKSTDGGQSFELIRGPHGDHHALWIAPEDNRRMVNGNDGGATISFDGGKSWSPLDNQPTGQFYWVATDHRFPYRLYGAQQDNTTVSIPSRSDGPGIGPRDWYSVGGGESGHVAPRPDDPDIVFAGSYWGLMTRYDHRTGETRNVSIWPDLPLGRVGAELRYRFNWTYPILVSPHDPSVVYAAANVVFRSTNEGRSWEVLSPDLTRDDKSKQRDGKLTDFYCTLTALAESPRTQGVLWAGSDDGMVHLSRDGGRSWKDVTPKAMKPWSRINVIEASPHDPARAYLAVNRYQLDDFRPYIYATDDYGASWRLLSSDLPDGDFVRTVREDPDLPGLLYAGTETGVVVSLDGGEHWRSLRLNLPAVPVTDLAVRGEDLVAATQGRGFWILDDRRPLQALARGMAADAPFLVPPPDAIRLPGRRSFGHRLGLGENPPNGLILDYFLPDETSGAVAIAFVEQDGDVIATFDGDAVSARPGWNRFVWDLRYPEARGLEGMPTYLFGGTLQGPMALPGTYRVRLAVGGESWEQTFRVRTDPRLGDVSLEGLRGQFDLLLRIRDRLSATHDAANRILALRRSLAAIPATAPADILAGARRLDGGLEAVLSELVELRFRGIDDQMLVFPLKLNAAFASLIRVVASAERPPTKQAVEVFELRSRELDGALARLAELVETDLPELNRRLREAGLAPLATELN